MIRASIQERKTLKVLVLEKLANHYLVFDILKQMSLLWLWWMSFVKTLLMISMIVHFYWKLHIFSGFCFIF